MKIAVLANSYGSLSETFVRREVEALQQRGHTCAVFTGWEVSGPCGAPFDVPVARWTDDAAMRAFAPDVLYATMGLFAHHRADAIAQKTNTPVCYRVWSGYDAFVRVGVDFYRSATAHRLCLGVIVEDEWMRRYAIDAMGIQADRTHIVPNSIDVDRFCPTPIPHDGPLRVLAVARFVEKKGLIHLVRAWNRLIDADPSLTQRAELVLVGYGPEEDALRREANPSVQFRCPVAESELPALYQSSDIFVAPCVRSNDGDADGVPTTVLEAMSCGLTVIASDMLSARGYLDARVLVAPGDVAVLADRLATVVLDAERRQEQRDRNRSFVVDQLDIRKNIERIEAVLATGSRAVRWHRGLTGITEARSRRTPERNAAYDDFSRRALDFWDISGEVLDVGCGDGWLRSRLNGCVTGYTGIDVAEAMPAGVAFSIDPNILLIHGRAESLPFEAARFDTVICNSVLQHVEDAATALAEMYRVLKAGGRLALEVNVSDPNPIFLSWWDQADVLALVCAAGFDVVRSAAMWDGRCLLVNARRTE